MTQSATGRSLVVGFAALAALAACKPKEGGSSTPAADGRERVQLAFHVMSQCPFGVQVENGIKPVLDQLGSAVDFKLFFIGDEAAGELASMHGAKEVKGDLLQVCAMKVAPDRFMDVVICMDKDSKAIPGNFDACAAEAKVDAAKINACANGDEGKKLLSASFAASRNKGARGSPTIFLAGEKYEGGRESNDFLRAVCRKFKTDKPEPCKALPEPKKVDLVVLTDARCKDCAAEKMLPRFKAAFPGLTEPRIVDYATGEGAQLHADLRAKGVTVLPAYLLSASAAEEPTWSQFQSSATDVGPWKVVLMGGKFDPQAEICDNGKDDDGNGKIDCDDPGCSRKMTCRKANPDLLEVFVMSQCPFGVKALNSMKEILGAFDRKIDFQIHYIADETTPGQFKSMHGQGEVDEDLRELCAIKHYRKDFKFMDYIWCRNADIRSADWQKCATGGIDAKVIEACSTGDEGKGLLAQDLKEAKELGIGGSPTWLANNKFQFSGIAPEAVKQMFCAYNKNTKGCEKTLTSDVKGPSGGCGSN